MFGKREAIYEMVFIGAEAQTDTLINSINKNEEYGKDVEEYAKLRRKLGMPVLSGKMPSPEQIKREIIFLKKRKKGRREYGEKTDYN